MAKRAADRALEIFRVRGGILRTSDALNLGIAPRVLYFLRDSGKIELVCRGVYRLADALPEGSMDLLTVGAAIPAGVVCLISALSFHNLTTQIPHHVDVALPRNWNRPRLRYPPVQVYWYDPKTMGLGQEEHAIDGFKVAIYDRERTIVDCFKFRSRIGLDVAIEGLKTYWRSERRDIGKLLRYAAELRVKSVIEPYVQALAGD